MAIELDKLRLEIRSGFRQKRGEHILKCEEMAVILAVRFCADERQSREAALLHDITKEKTYHEQLNLCRAYGIILDNVEKRESTLLHAITGAEVARRVYGASPEVCAAVRYHTTGRVGMSLLEKIICLADYIEPTRSFEGVGILRKLAETDLNMALRRAMENSMSHIIKKGGLLHPDTLYARNALITGEGEPSTPCDKKISAASRQGNVKPE